MRIGEFLVQKNLITKEQLKEALEAQLIFGGQLGTCLMERNFITERQLGKVLADILRVGYASPERFEKIRRHVIETFSERLVERHRAVPFALEERTLDVAMVDPQDLLARDALSFASGYKIRPWVAPESRILQAMERYYGIRRGLRYVSLCRDKDQSTPDASAPEAPTVRTAGERRRKERRAPGQSRAASGAATASATAVLEAPVDADGLSAFSSELLRAESVDQVAALVVAQGLRTLERCAVLMVKLDRALPWLGGGWSFDRSNWDRLSFPVISEPVFSLLNGDDLFRGAVPRQPEYLRFFSALGLDVPAEAIIVTTHVDDRLVAVLYGDGGPHERVLGEDNHYRRLARKFGLALSLVESRKKLNAA